MQRFALLLVLLVPAFAGCLSDGTDQDTDRPAPSTDLAAWPEGDHGVAAHGYIESYVMTHPFRVHNMTAHAVPVSGAPIPAEPSQGYMESAREDLAAILEGFGLDVVRHEYNLTSDGVNILGFQYGTEDPDQWVVLSAHYDTVGVRPGGIGPTVYGAWDDGAGVGVLLELAETMVNRTYPFTVVYAFFDGEEKGLLGSAAFVQEHFQDGQHDLVANINTDPPGLNWPCGDAKDGAFPVRIIQEDEKADLHVRYAWLYDGVEWALNASAVPQDMRDFSTQIEVATVAGQGIGGQSDHVKFGEVDIANVYFGGTPTTEVGPATVLTYNFHTPLDTLQQMEARCSTGDPESTLANGLGTIVKVMGNLVEYLAHTGVPN